MAIVQVLTAPDLDPSKFSIVDTADGKKVTLSGAATNEFFKAVSLVTDPAPAMYVFTRQDNTTVSVAAHIVDISLDASNVSYDASSTVLTLGQTNGGPAVTVNLSALAKSSVGGTDTVSLSGDGSSGNPLKAQVIVDPAGGLATGAAGVKLGAPAEVNNLSHDVILQSLGGVFLMSGGSTPTQ